MSIASEITRINNNIASAYHEINGKGGTLPQIENSANLATAIATIPTGGGGIGLDYETGEYIPSADTNSPTISFNDTRATTPAYIFIKDNEQTNAVPNNGVLSWEYVDYEKIGYPIRVEGNQGNVSSIYTHIYLRARGASNTSIGTANVNCSYSSSDSRNISKAYPRYFMNESGFYPKSNLAGSTSPIVNAVFKEDRHYTWIAIWI